MPAAKNVAAFIKASPEEPQPKLKQLRKIVKDVLPDAEETISYKMPLYKLHGKGVVAFAGFKSHIGFYPMSGSLLDSFKKELRNYKTSKGAVQFPLDKPLPVALIKRLIKARIKQGTKKNGKT